MVGQTRRESPSCCSGYTRRCSFANALTTHAAAFINRTSYRTYLQERRLLLLLLLLLLVVLSCTYVQCPHFFCDLCPQAVSFRDLFWFYFVILLSFYVGISLLPFFFLSCVRSYPVRWHLVRHETPRFYSRLVCVVGLSCIHTYVPGTLLACSMSLHSINSTPRISCEDFLRTSRCSLFRSGLWPQRAVFVSVCVSLYSRMKFRDSHLSVC